MTGKQLGGYMDKYDDNWPFFEKLLGCMRYRKIKPYLSKNDGRPVYVDIGCGFNGTFLFSVRRKIKKGYGFDIRANERQSGNVKIINNAECGGKIPLKAGVADRVFLLAVLEHLDKNNTVAEESVRVLKKEGQIIITTPAPIAKPVLEFLSYKLHLISEASIQEHRHYYNKQELIDLLDLNHCICETYKRFLFGFNQIIVSRKK